MSKLGYWAHRGTSACVFWQTILFASAGTAQMTVAQTETRLVAAGGLELDQAGSSLAASGDFVVIGAPLADSDAGVNAGIAYVFQRTGSTWTQVATLVPSDAYAGHRFGESVAADGNIIVVGAVGDSELGSLAGAVYVFRRNLDDGTWSEKQKLLAWDGASNASFGCSAALSDDLLLVGSYRQGGSPGPGAVYAFWNDGSEFREEDKIVAPDGSPGDFFGISVAVSGSVAIVGAPQDHDSDYATGSAYVFRRSGTTWSQEGAKLKGTNDAGIYTLFGHSVAVDGTVALVGDYAADSNVLGSNSGAVYIFRLNGSANNPQWIQEAKLHGSDTIANDAFGYSVSAGTDVAVVGVPNRGRSTATTEDGVGGVYVFRKIGGLWTESDRFTASDGRNYDRLGTSVAVSKDGFMGGAPGWGPLMGAGYVFEEPVVGGCSVDSECDDGLFCNGIETCDNVTGECQAGTPVDCDDGVDCTNDSCNEDTDSCDDTPDDGFCDDGLYCDGRETCDATAGCLAGEPVNCDDGVDCTSDSCNEDTDSCDNTPDNGFCDDGFYCDGRETCDATAGCRPGSDPCAGSTCDEANDRCIFGCQSDGECDDGLFCNGTEICNRTSGECRPGAAVSCDDGVACTVDVCNEDTDSCDNTPDDGFCDDGLFCDGRETCNSTAGCLAGSDPCGGGACDEDNDRCITGCQSDDDCDDGLLCNGTETCDLDTGECIAGTPLRCDDGLFCNGSETCVEGRGCQDGTAPCGRDECDEQNDRCITGCQSDAECDDGVYCNGVETCDLRTGQCQAGAPAACGNDLVCSESRGACVECNSDLDCYRNSSDECTTWACSDQGTCVSTPAHNCCGDGVCDRDLGETCAEDCSEPASCSAFECGNAICEIWAGENCNNCPEDCAGKASGHNAFCCGGEYLLGVDCADDRCTQNGLRCEMMPPSQEIPGLTCNDGLDNDCGGLTDCYDPDCRDDVHCWTCNFNGVCDYGENCKSCSADCAGQSATRRSREFCCGNGLLEIPEVLDPGICDGNY